MCVSLSHGFPLPSKELSTTTCLTEVGQVCSRALRNLISKSLPSANCITRLWKHADGKKKCKPMPWPQGTHSAHITEKCVYEATCDKINVVQKELLNAEWVLEREINSPSIWPALLPQPQEVPLPPRRGGGEQPHPHKDAHLLPPRSQPLGAPARSLPPTFTSLQR